MIIIDGTYGQLCNQLFTFANLIAFASEFDQIVVYPGFSKEARSFEYFHGKGVCVFPHAPARRSWVTALPSSARTIRLFCKLVRRVNPSACIALGDKRMLNLDDRDDPQTRRLASPARCVVSGLYFVGHETFSRHAERIRAIFRPTQAIATTVDDVAGAARRGGDVLVGVHVRQGDYQTFGNGLSFFTSEEYARVMRRVVGLFPGRRVRFLVCSNENQDGHFRDLNVHFGPGDTVGDLYALSCCDYLVGPPSTFTQWASFYGRVPRYVMAWKWEDAYHLPRTPLELNAFNVHTAGFGAH